MKDKFKVTRKKNKMNRVQQRRRKKRRSQILSRGIWCDNGEKGKQENVHGGVVGCARYKN